MPNQKQPEKKQDVYFFTSYLNGVSYEIAQQASVRVNEFLNELNYLLTMMRDIPTERAYPDRASTIKTFLGVMESHKNNADDFFMACKEWDGFVRKLRASFFSYLSRKGSEYEAKPWEEIHKELMDNLSRSIKKIQKPKPYPKPGKST